MGISKHPSCVHLPDTNKPYPSILEFLTKRFPGIGPTVWERRILDEKVLDEAGTPVTMETDYRPLTKLFYFREVAEEQVIPLQEKILLQNDEFLVACKPPFLPVTPSGPYVNECLLNRLKISTGNNDLSPLHRIDRETSGLVLFSMNKETRGLYGKLFLSGSIEKTYVAVAAASQRPKSPDITVENRMVAAEPWFRMKSVPGAVNARSRIRLIDFRDNQALFLLNPLTGKKHQLRLHMSGLGFSIMNDRYYPELRAKQADDLDNPLQLIAKRVKFKDPVSGRNMEFESERKLLF